MKLTNSQWREATLRHYSSIGFFFIERKGLLAKSFCLVICNLHSLYQMAKENFVRVRCEDDKMS